MSADNSTSISSPTADISIRSASFSVFFGAGALFSFWGLGRRKECDDCKRLFIPGDEVWGLQNILWSLLTLASMPESSCQCLKGYTPVENKTEIGLDLVLMLMFPKAARIGATTLFAANEAASPWEFIFHFTNFKRGSAAHLVLHITRSSRPGRHCTEDRDIR